MSENTTDAPDSTPEVEAVEQYDASAHGVDEVNAYLDDAEPDEVARVLTAEGESEKPRKGIVEGRHAAVVEAATPEELLGDADPYELVRAKDAQTGSEYTTSRMAALNAGAKVLDKPATDSWGSPIPTKTVLDLRAETDPNAAAESQPSTDSPKE